MNLITSRSFEIIMYPSSISFNNTHQTAVLSMMYITALSYGLVIAGIIIRYDESDTETSPNLLFAGGFLAALGWVS